MIKHRSYRKAETVERLLIRYLLLISFVFIAVVGLINYLRLLANVERELIDTSSTILRKLTTRIAAPIYELDDESFYQTIEAEFESDIIKAILFSENTDESQLSKGMSRTGGEVKKIFDDSGLDSYWEETNYVSFLTLNGELEDLGELHLFLDSDMIYSRMIKKWVIELIRLLLLVMILTSAVYVLLHRLLTVPINRLTKNLGSIKRSIEDGNLDFETNIAELKTLKNQIPMRSEEIETVTGAIEQLLLSVKNDRDQLERAKLEAEGANKAKEEFLSVISHEMRTPMNPLMGFIDHLMEQDETSRFREVFDMMKRAGFELLEHIDNILTYSKLNYNSIEVRFEKLDLVELSEKLHTKYRGLAVEKKLDYRIRVLVDDEWVSKATVQTDLFLLENILETLISNAFKFTCRGSVNVEMRFLTTTDSNDLNTRDQLQISVKDTGFGIQSSKVDDLFHSFTQADQTMSREHGGLGLGLAICAKALKFLNGDVEVVSEVDLGSDFKVTIPIVIDEVEAQPTKKSADETKVRFCDYNFTKTVLVVEDDKFNRLVLERLLKVFNVNLLFATNGLEGVSLYKRESCDLVFMDISMPKMNGIDATKEIRSLESHQSQSTPIIAYTAHTDAGLRSQCLEAGMDGYVVKPASKYELNHVLRTWIR